MKDLILLSNGNTIKVSEVKKAQKEVLLTLEKVLPKKHFNAEVINLVLDVCKYNLNK